MKEQDSEKTPYDIEKQETAIFQMILVLIFLMILAFAIGQVLPDLGIKLISFIKTP